jgi:hypothetical protein
LNVQDVFAVAEVFAVGAMNPHQSSSSASFDSFFTALVQEVVGAVDLLRGLGGAVV